MGSMVERMSEDRTLEGLWKTARKGYLSPLEQLRAVAFRDAYHAGNRRRKAEEAAYGDEVEYDEHTVTPYHTGGQ